MVPLLNDARSERCGNSKQRSVRRASEDKYGTSDAARDSATGDVLAWFELTPSVSFVALYRQQRRPGEEQPPTQQKMQ
jgi:hypothetical protein